MTRTAIDIEKVRGDLKRWRIIIVEDATELPPPTAFSGSVIARLTVKKRLDDLMSDALIKLSTYDPSELLVVNAANWEFLATVKSGVDNGFSPGRYRWDFETIRGGTSLKSSPGNGTAETAAGSGIITFSDLTVPAAASIGDVLDIQGQSVAVIETPASSADLLPSQIETDFLGLSANVAESFDLLQGDVKTPDKLFGAFTILADVTG